MEHIDTTLQNNLMYSGGGNDNPVVMKWLNTGVGISPEVVSRFEHGHSVYALAISPNGLRIAAGTKKGLVRVHNIIGQQDSDETPIVFEVFHLPGVFSLAFCTDDILASGGGDGHIKLWSVSQQKQLADIPADTSAVFALREIGSLVLASIGADGLLRVWDMDSNKLQYESSHFDLPRIHALSCLDYNPQTGYLVHPSRNGNIHMYDVNNDFRNSSVTAHQGDFSALAYGSSYLATAGMDELKIKIWSLPSNEAVMEATTPAATLAICWSSTTSIMTGYADSTTQIWKVANNLTQGVRSGNLNIRSALGLPAGLQFRQQARADRQWRDKTVAKAKDFVEQPDKRRELATVIEELCRKGFSVEAGLILADAAQKQNHPLWELEVRLAMIEGLGESKAAMPSLYALARLLQTLKEPQLARHYFGKIDIQYLDTNERIHQLEDSPILNLTPERHIRGDLIQNDLINLEIEKDTILKKKFRWRLIHKKGKPISSNIRLTNQDIFDGVLEALEQYGADIESSRLLEVSIFENNRFRNATWIYAPSIDNLPIAFALEVYSASAKTIITPYGIFDTNMLEMSDSLSSQEHNEKVRNAHTMFDNSSEAKQWLAQARKLALQKIELLASKAAAKKDNRY